MRKQSILTLAVCIVLFVNGEKCRPFNCSPTPFPENEGKSGLSFQCAKPFTFAGLERVLVQSCGNLNP